MLKLVQKLEIECNRCGRFISIAPEDLEFQTSSYERSMGPEIDYYCRDEFSCDCGNRIEYEVQGFEYPAGAYNFDISDCRGGHFLKGAVWEIEYEPDYEEYDGKGIEYYQNLINKMSPREFEYFVSDICRDSGFEVVEVTQQTRDGGYDIMCRANHPVPFSAIVECKHYSGTVGEPIIRSAYGVLEHYRNVNTIIVATSSVFSRQAVDFAKQHGDRIQLWDGRTLAFMFMDKEIREGKF